MRRQRGEGVSRDAAREASNIVKGQVARLKPLHKAAILLHALRDETTREVTRGLREFEVKGLLAEIDRLPDCTSVETVAVVHEFFHIHRLFSSLGDALETSDDILKAVERWASRHPRRLALLLKESWLSPRV